MARLMILVGRLCFAVGVTAGLIVGLIAAWAGVLLAPTLPERANFAVSVFWLLLLILPLLYAWRGTVLIPALQVTAPGRIWRLLLALVGWLISYAAAVVTFMIPVVVVPIILKQGVSFDTATDWYNTIYARLLGGPVGWIGLATLLGVLIVTLWLWPAFVVASA